MKAGKGKAKVEETGKDVQELGLGTRGLSRLGCGTTRCEMRLQ